MTGVITTPTNFKVDIITQTEIITLKGTSQQIGTIRMYNSHSKPDITTGMGCDLRNAWTSAWLAWPLHVAAVCCAICFTDNDDFYFLFFPFLKSKPKLK